MLVKKLLGGEGGEGGRITLIDIIIERRRYTLKYISREQV